MGVSWHDDRPTRYQRPRRVHPTAAMERTRKVREACWSALVGGLFVLTLGVLYLTQT